MLVLFRESKFRICLVLFDLGIATLVYVQKHANTGSSWEPLDVPLARALDILDCQLERIKVQSRHRIKGNIEENKGPFEKGVDGVSCAAHS